MTDSPKPPVPERRLLGTRKEPERPAGEEKKITPRKGLPKPLPKR